MSRMSRIWQIWQISPVSIGFISPKLYYRISVNTIEDIESDRTRAIQRCAGVETRRIATVSSEGVT
jgi:hypothetical protein